VILNYTPVDKDALLELISLIKGTTAVIIQHVSFLIPLLRRYVYEETQYFVHVTAFPVLRHAIKKSRPMRDGLMELRSVCMDWSMDQGPIPSENDLTSKEMKSSFEHCKYPHRSVGVSATQLFLIRTMITSILELTAGSQV
jgi:hypothetical protein